MGTRDAGRKDSAGPAVAEPALRQRAEEQVQGMGVEDVGMLSPEAAQQLVHELRVHQIELEMQNEELRRMQEVLEASRARYFDLYDLAPVGYVTLNEQGLILEANLTATTMLGVPRGALVKQPLTRSIVPEDEDIYYLHRKRLLETGTPQVCQLRMERQYPRPSQFWARLESIVVQDEESGAPVCRVTMSDITKQKGAEREVEELAYDLGERVKELNCLYGISNLVEIPGISLEEVLQGTVDLIPPAWQYPEVTCARITLEGQEFSTKNFNHSPWQQTAGILAHSEQIGTVQVGYLQERPESDEGPFLKEERNLIDTIARRLGEISERMRGQRQLWQQHQFLRNILDSLPHPFYVINTQDRTVEMANSAALAGRLYEKRTCFTLVHGRDRPCELEEDACPLHEVMRTKRPVVVEHVHTDTEGGCQDVEVYGYPVVDRDGNVVQMIEYTLNISQRKQAEQALRESEARWRSLTETSPDHILMLDTDLKIQFANFASPGLTVDELIGIPLYTLVDETEQTEIKAILENSVETGTPTRYETVYNRPDGDDIYYESRVAPRTLSGSNELVGLTVSARDITERKKAEQAMRDSEERLRALFEILPVGISVLDESSEIQFANPALARIMRVSQDQQQSGEYETHTYLRADGTEMPPDELPSSRALREQRLVRDVEICVVMGDCERIWISVSAVPLPSGNWRVIITTIDITDRKRAEMALSQAHDELELRVKERTAELAKLNELLRGEITERQHVEKDLRASEERFLQLADHINHAFWISDLATNQLLYVSRAYEDLWGRARQIPYEQLTSLLENIHREDRKRVEVALEQGSREEQVEQCRLVRPDGSLLWVRIRAFPVRDEQGRAYRLAGIAEDISEQVQAVQLLEQRVEERTLQLAALLQFARRMTLTLELGPLLELILDVLQGLVEYDGAVIYEQEGEELAAVAHRGLGLPGEKLGQGPIHLVESETAQRILSGLESSLLSNIQGRTDDSLLAPVSDWACCGMAAPLRIRQRVVGLLVLYSRQPQRYSQQQAALLLALANQAAVGIENAQLYEQAQALAVIEERQRLARDLHDAVSQTLFSANIIAEALPRIWDRDPESVRRRLPQLHRLTSGALAEMRTLLLELRPTALVDVEFSELLKQAVDAFSGRTRTVLSLALVGQRCLSAEVQVALYRIAQEALNNVAKHAKATEATIHLHNEPDRVVLRIRDNGQGFDPDRIPPGCMGLNILRERARAIGATLEVSSQPGDGTELVVVWTETP